MVEHFWTQGTVFADVGLAIPQYQAQAQTRAKMTCDSADGNSKLFTDRNSLVHGQQIHPATLGVFKWTVEERLSCWSSVRKDSPIPLNDNRDNQVDYLLFTPTPSTAGMPTRTLPNRPCLLDKKSQGTDAHCALSNAIVHTYIW